ncbi:MAG TPA: efflux RND transporter periplasmic adaptor subunit [Flavobacteriaceae bacterium]|nr:efflux RND transporter periplasmic adaptor subunit [Flavobacteriaceae bacterium]
MKSYINLFGLIILSIVVAACSQASAEKSNSSESEKSKPVYEVTNLKSDTLKYKLNLPGDLLPYDQVTLYAKVEGFVKDINVDRGDKVEKGEVLAFIEAPEIAQKYLSAKSKEREILEKLSFSAQNYKYLKEASSVDGAVSTIEVEQAKSRFMADSAALNTVRAEVSAAEHLAKYRTITAPFSGIITDRLISSGALVGGERQALFKLSREDKLRLSVAIPGKHANALQPGSQAEFSVNGYPGKRFSVELSRNSKVLNPELRSSMVEYDVDNSEDLLNAGDYADVNIAFQRNSTSWQVPASSIIQTKTDNFVAKVVSGKVQLIPVTTGITYDRKIEIFGDLEDQDQIITSANSSLRDGMEIKTTPIDEK